MRACARRWFDAEMAWEAKPSGHRGRQQAYSDAAIQACLTMKVLFGLPLRQTTGFVEGLPELMGLDCSVPDFSTLCRRQKTLPVAIPYRGSTGPLHLLIPSRALLRNTLPGQRIVPALKLGAYCRPETATEAQTCLGDPCQAGTCREPSRSDSIQYGH